MGARSRTYIVCIGASIALSACGPHLIKAQRKAGIELEHHEARLSARLPISIKYKADQGKAYGGGWVPNLSSVNVPGTIYFPCNPSPARTGGLKTHVCSVEYRFQATGRRNEYAIVAFAYNADGTKEALENIYEIIVQAEGFKRE